MTTFNKEDFSYHGGYLMYHGDYVGSKTYDEVYGAENCHPSRVGMRREAFIARFKYKGIVTKAAFVKELIKNHTVEAYLTTLQDNKCMGPLIVLSDANPAWYANLLEKFNVKYGVPS